MLRNGGHCNIHVSWGVRTDQEKCDRAGSRIAFRSCAREDRKVSAQVRAGVRARTIDQRRDRRGVTPPASARTTRSPALRQLAELMQVGRARSMPPSAVGDHWSKPHQSQPTRQSRDLRSARPKGGRAAVGNHRSRGRWTGPHRARDRPTGCALDIVPPKDRGRFSKISTLENSAAAIARVFSSRVPSG